MTRLRRAFVIVIAVISGLLASSTAARANAVFPFRADSGDNCRYGTTQGSLIWRYSTTTPIRPITLDVRGTLVDHPLPDEWGFLCRDDGYYSVATFVAYLSNGTTARAEARADNAIVSLGFTLGSSSTTSSISRATVQVCRSPLRGTGASYCGTPQHYAPVVYDPPPPTP
ncbi:hypothetical protein GCM10023170_082490 [Phytohabitans houttuyneae]|uniref:Secreted protein n=1 Tax=Phytohabitans houttuyneae TaxID=1076126 RepID=A0A6V8KIL9_9ACTN|nr:hypothetical protein Phou_061490 [Phytohabitans houttuyneae]